MDSVKYIGMDVHKEAISIAVLNSSGKLVMECTIETKAITILEFLKGLRGIVTAFCSGWLLLEYQRRPADSLCLEVDSHLDAVGDLDEGNAAVHTEFLTVERHGPFNCPLA
jgi:hypothetical protein